MTNATQTTTIDLQEYLEYTYPKLTDNEINHISNILRNVLKKNERTVEISTLI